MPEAFDHGPRLSDAEYDRAIVALHSGLPPKPSRDLDRQTRRRALDLAIDHRLGRHFPHDRREALWAIQQRVDRRRGRLLFKYLLRRFLARGLARDAQGLARGLVAEYATVLTPAELEAYFGAEEARHPALPVDLDVLRKG